MLISFLGICLMIVQDPIETGKLAVVLVELIICISTSQKRVQGVRKNIHEH